MHSDCRFPPTVLSAAPGLADWVLFRERRRSVSFVVKKSSGDITIIDSNTREVTAWDVIELFCRLYGYPRP